jgi:hypothetical protein
VGDFLLGLEATRQAANATIASSATVAKNTLRGLDPEDAARRSGSRLAIRRYLRRGSLNSLDPCRNVVDKGNGNRRNRETEETPAD